MSEISTAQQFETYLLPTYARFPVSFVRGEGAILYDEQGESYLDFAAGVAVNSLGHAHPKLIKTISEQAVSLIHCSNLYLNPWQGKLAMKLSQNVMRLSGRSFFCNSGAEANEALIKFARRFALAKKISAPEIITFNNSFHGRTMAGITATGQQKVKVGFEPLLPGFHHAEFNNLESLKSKINSQTVAIMIEIVQGEGGLAIAEKDFLSSLQEICQQEEILLMIDEVQAGLGRTGEVNSWESLFSSNDSFRPHAVSWAKGLGGGVPIGAIWVQELLFNKYQSQELFNPGSHGSTFGGNPLATATALTILEEILETSFLKQVKLKSAELREKLLALHLPWLKSLKGIGLMLGLEIDQDWVRKQPDYTSDVMPSIYIVKKLFAKKILSVAAGEGVVRFLPPLNIDTLTIDKLIDRLASR